MKDSLQEKFLTKLKGHHDYWRAKQPASADPDVKFGSRRFNHPGVVFEGSHPNFRLVEKVVGKFVGRPYDEYHSYVSRELTSPDAKYQWHNWENVLWEQPDGSYVTRFGYRYKDPYWFTYLVDLNGIIRRLPQKAERSWSDRKNDPSKDRHGNVYFYCKDMKCWITKLGNTLYAFTATRNEWTREIDPSTPRIPTAKEAKQHGLHQKHADAAMHKGYFPHIRSIVDVFNIQVY